MEVENGKKNANNLQQDYLISSSMIFFKGKTKDVKNF